MSKTHDEIVKEVFDRDEKLRRMALTFIMQNVPVHGNRTTLRALQLCFIAGYEAGHHAGYEGCLKIQEAVTEHLEKQMIEEMYVNLGPLLKEDK